MQRIGKLVAVTSFMGVAVIFIILTLYMSSNTRGVSVYIYDKSTDKYSNLQLPEIGKKNLESFLNTKKSEVAVYNADKFGLPEVKIIRGQPLSKTLKKYHRGFSVYYLEHLDEFIWVDDEGYTVINAWGEYAPIYKLLKGVE